MMLAPLMREEGVWGYMGIDIVDGYRKWNSEDYQWFSSLANIISICMELRIIKERVMHSEKLFHDIFTNIPVGLELYNKEGVLLDCNNRNLEIFGVGDKSRIVGLNLFESPNMKRRKRVRNASLTVICVFVRQMVRIGGTGYTSLLW